MLLVKHIIILFLQACPKLIDRFKEREENVKVSLNDIYNDLFITFCGLLCYIVLLQMDVFNTFIELLRQTGNVTKGQTDTNELRQVLKLF